jgi:hypothetical protein
VCHNDCRKPHLPGTNETSYTQAYRRGRQDEAFDTYADNLAATEQRIQLEVERAHVKRWGEQ